MAKENNWMFAAIIVAVVGGVWLAVQSASKDSSGVTHNNNVVSNSALNIAGATSVVKPYFVCRTSESEQPEHQCIPQEVFTKLAKSEYEDFVDGYSDDKYKTDILQDVYCLKMNISVSKMRAILAAKKAVGTDGKPVEIPADFHGSMASCFPDMAACANRQHMIDKEYKEEPKTKESKALKEMISFSKCELYTHFDIRDFDHFTKNKQELVVNPQQIYCEKAPIYTNNIRLCYIREKSCLGRLEDKKRECFIRKTAFCHAHSKLKIDNKKGAGPWKWDDSKTTQICSPTIQECETGRKAAGAKGSIGQPPVKTPCFEARPDEMD